MFKPLVEPPAHRNPFYFYCLKCGQYVRWHAFAIDVTEDFKVIYHYTCSTCGESAAKTSENETREESRALFIKQKDPPCEGSFCKTLMAVSALVRAHRNYIPKRVIHRLDKRKDATIYASDYDLICSFR